jgi:thiosulfate/3-mercaptopyruvate sulfurtransferase
MPYTTLISCADAHTQIYNPAWRFFDCRFDLMKPDSGQEQYRADHIPGATYVHLNEDLSSPIGPRTGRHPLPDVNALATKLCQWGVGDETQVVVYDNDIGMFASRMWWLLRWLGHEKVAVLDGGYQAWKAQGQPVTAEVKQYQPASFTLRLQEGWTVTTHEIIALEQEGDVLLDARAPERYRGEVEPIDPVAGHIPGALNYPLTNNIDEDGLFKEDACIRTQLGGVIGETGAPQVIHYCGSGVSACHNILAMEHAGMHGSKLYAGSWSEWIRDPVRRVEKG